MESKRDIYDILTNCTVAIDVLKERFDRHFIQQNEELTRIRKDQLDFFKEFSDYKRQVDLYIHNVEKDSIKENARLSVKIAGISGVMSALITWLASMVKGQH